MLTKKSKYGIKALIYLGKNYGEQPVQIMRIATEEQIPKKILRANSLRAKECRIAL